MYNIIIGIEYGIRNRDKLIFFLEKIFIYKFNFFLKL